MKRIIDCLLTSVELRATLFIIVFADEPAFHPGKLVLSDHSNCSRGGEDVGDLGVRGRRDRQRETERE